MKTKSKILAIALVSISMSSFLIADTTNNLQNTNFQTENQNNKKISKEDFYAKLNLSKDQKTKLDGFFSEFDKTMKNNSPKSQGTLPEKGTMDKAIDELNVNVKTVLNGSQYETYKKNINSFLMPPGAPPTGEPQQMN